MSVGTNVTTRLVRRRERARSAGAVGRIGPGPVRKAASYILLTALTLVFVAPILYMIIGSLKPSDAVLAGLSGFKPQQLSFHNYSAMFNRFNSDATGRFQNFYLTSLIVSGVVVVGGLVVNSLAAYALARLRWRGRNAVLVVVIALIIIPFEAIAVPLFYLLNGYRNTYFVQFLPFVASAFSIYLFYSFFTGLPRQLDEAARVDGAGPWKTFLLIVVPMSKPVYATVTILTFLTSWSSFLWPVLMVDEPTVRPLPLEIAVFQGLPPYDWGQTFAFGVLLVAPILVVFLVFQRWFVQSVASAGVKG
jgi:multiple sugar transport system permease protein